jgi:hypothetical protein
MPNLLRRRGNLGALDVREVLGASLGTHRPKTASNASEK